MRPRTGPTMTNASWRSQDPAPHSAHRWPPPVAGVAATQREHICRCQRRTTADPSRLAGPSGLAAALVLGAAGPASASVHRAASPAPDWLGTRRRGGHDRDPYGLVAGGDRGPRRLRRRRVPPPRPRPAQGHDEPADATPAAPDLEAILRPVRPAPVAALGRAVRRAWASVATRRRRRPVPMGSRRRSGSSASTTRPPPPPETDRVMDSAYRG